MSGFAESLKLPISVKEELKEEDFDDFFPEYLHAVQSSDGPPGLDYDRKNETPTSLISTYKEEDISSVKTEDGGDSGLGEYDHNISPTGR